MAEEIRYIDHSAIPPRSKVCLYGVGNGGLQSLLLLQKVRPDIEVVCFADSYKSGEFEGLKVLAPRELVEQGTNIDLILICSCYYKEIISSLYELGIRNIAAFFWPKFFNYQFLPEELHHFQDRIDFIKKHLDTDDDRKLFQFLCDSRVVGSKDVEVAFSKNGSGTVIFKNSGLLASSFPKHTTLSYFDFVDLSDVEYVVQAGVYDGSEAIFILEHSHQLKKIYGFDPQGKKAIADGTFNILEESGKVTLVKKGLWSRSAKADFVVDGSASFVNTIHDEADSGSTTLCSLTEEARALAIPKLDLLICDIENSEVPMLEGAMELILADRPQLAVCFYHSKQQFIEIPLMLINQLENYVFKIGHYSEGLDESVFYAIPKEKYSGYQSY